jgi:hypothetical protein
VAGAATGVVTASVTTGVTTDSVVVTPSTVGVVTLVSTTTSVVDADAGVATVDDEAGTLGSESDCTWVPCSLTSTPPQATKNKVIHTSLVIYSPLIIDKILYRIKLLHCFTLKLD